MSNTHTLILILVTAAVTALIRFLPFIVFAQGRKTPDIILYLGKVLPYSIMGMLVVFCMKNISFLQSPRGIPEGLACLSIVLVHKWKRNTILSILCGTVVYMLLIQHVF